MATVEYAALVVLVAAATAIAGATLGSERIARAVGAQITRALCLVQGGDCLDRAGPRPCVVGSRKEGRESRADILVVHLRDGRSVLRERLSDGTVRVRILRSGGMGAGVEWGTHLTVGGLRVRASATTDAYGELAAGRTFLVADAAAADRLVLRLERDGPQIGGAAGEAVRFVRGGDGDERERFLELRAGGHAEAVLKAVGLGARAPAMGQYAASLRIDRRTGERTVGLRLEGELPGVLGAPFGELGFGLQGATAAEVVFDRRGRAVSFLLRRTQAISGSAQVGSFRSEGGDRGELEARLDLADARSRALVDRLAHGDAGAAPELARRLFDRARLDVRHYATTHDERTRGLSGGIIMRGGVQQTTSTDTARLVHAYGREPGMGWARRLDCLTAASA